MESDTFEPSTPQDASDSSLIPIRAICQTILSPSFFSFEKALFFFSQGGPTHQLGGLLNVGYNCYVNAVIQCLAYTPGFSQFCLSLPNVMYQQNSHSAFFLDSFAHIFSEIESNKSMSPTWLLTDSHLISETFKKPIQQDAHEYLLAILDVFEKECINSEIQNQNSNQSQNSNDKNDVSKSDTMIDHFFAGDLTIEVQCHNCSSVIPRKTKFHDLTVPIREYSDLQAAIDSITSSSEIVISGKCENCKEEGDMTKTNKFTKFPLVLIITLLRFDNTCKKIEDFFKFPKKLIVGNHKYELYSMILHDGRLINHGHFVAFVMDENKVWYKADDGTIYKIKDEAVMSSCPYVLFYKRIID
ncbi:Clan CA, family C19, ubiquitin hydrolase-like cysteine peptidase [Tritrichomonas foetus]|uniref:ubiquitinyl hydrolase 1 n=1 Tax=Tritrichomonas foetus TaxID=1144522 RepID=A0A1J4JXW1_9EUKA|nr:Clan CA, family C19, ubiquitin hydrolase-like cysteine peptidase [Tritrichomonas foetus]|eukprot:OHT03993.1 Clan CA, family C19, ubiquitin hydrolase-like cysteine peptidase [Tritrichomonas foetus]